MDESRRGAVAEVEARGRLAFGTLKLEAQAHQQVVVQGGDVCRQLRSAKERGARAVLLIVDSLGGHFAAGLAVFSELRRLSEEGCPSVAWVADAAYSAAVPAILGADYVMAHPRALIWPHRPFSAAGAVEGLARSADVPEGEAAAADQEMIAESAALHAVLLMERTGMPKAEAVRLMQPNGVKLDARDAARLGMLDFSGGIQRARELAARLAQGGHVGSPRQAAMEMGRERAEVAVLGPELRRRAARYAEQATAGVAGTEPAVLNQMLYREAKRVREHVDAVRAQLERTTGEAWRSELGLASPAYRDVHDELLAAIGIGRPLDKAEPRATFDQMLQVAAGDAAVMDESWQPTVRSLLGFARDWTELTPDEVQAVRDAVTNIRRAANQKNQVVLLDKTMTKDHLLAEMDRAAREANPTRARGARDSATEGDQVTLRKGMRGLWASGRGVETIAKYLDGENRDGPFHRMFVDGLLAARNKEAELAKAYGKVLLDAWAAMPDEVKNRRFELVDLRQDLPLAEGLRESAWVDDTAVQRTYLWMVFLNRGNRENLQRLLDGYGWTLDQVDAALEKHLTPAEGRFLQKILNSLEGLYPEISALHERDTGLKPGKVRAEPFTLRLGGGELGGSAGEAITFEGGYFPAKYDPRPGMSKRGYAAQEREIASILNPESLYPGTPKGHTKQRAVAVQDVINLNWGVVPAHVSQVIHDLAFREYVRQAAAVVVDPRFRTTVASTIGMEYFDQFKPWLQAVATGREVAVTSEIRSAFGLVMLGRSRAMVGALGHRISTALGDLTNPLIAIGAGRVRPDYMARATWQLTPGAPGWRETWSLVSGDKEVAFRAERAVHHLREEFKAIGETNALMRNPTTRELGELVRGAQETAFVLMETTDRLSSAQIWYGAYLQEMARAEAEGRPDADARARRAAGDVLRELQPAEWVGEKAALLRRRDVFGSILMFYGWLNKMNQLKYLGVHRAIAKWGDATAGIGEGMSATAKAAGVMLGVTGAIALGDLASGHGKLQDDEDWGAWWRRKMTAGEFVDLPFVGPWVEWAYSRYVEGKSAQFPVRTAPGLAFGENLLREVAKAGSGEAAVDERLWAALRAAGLVTGLPVTQVSQTGQYVTSGRLSEDWTAGRPLDVASGLVYGERPNQPETPLTAAQKAISGR